VISSQRTALFINGEKILCDDCLLVPCNGMSFIGTANYYGVWRLIRSKKKILSVVHIPIYNNHLKNEKKAQVILSVLGVNEMNSLYLSYTDKSASFINDIGMISVQPRKTITIKVLIAQKDVRTLSDYAWEFKFPEKNGAIYDLNSKKCIAHDQSVFKVCCDKSLSTRRI
jgi:hypothetical protein